MSIYLDFYLEVFMHLFQEVGSEVIEAWKTYGIADVYLDFRLF